MSYYSLNVKDRFYKQLLTSLNNVVGDGKYIFLSIDI